MAKSAHIVGLALLLAFLLATVFIAEGRPTPTDAAVAACTSIHGVEQDETCSSIAQSFKLDLPHFLAINPNINCEHIFVGQWVCVAGTVA